MDEARHQNEPWPVGIAPTVALGKDGLTLGFGTPLMRFVEDERLAITTDGERALALLSIVARRPLDPDQLFAVETAARYWERGDKALANLRLTFANLPRLQEPLDADRLAAAAHLLDHGMTPAALLKELGLPPVRALAKYSPDQPRVPAGHGIESGRWTDTAGGGLLPPITLGVVSNVPSHGTDIAAEDLKPGGEIVVPLPEPNPLDPKQLNRLLPPQEEQAIADTLNIISGGTDAEIKALQPHPYRNLPHLATRAMLPPSLSGYTAYSLAGSGRGSNRGEGRIVRDQGTGAAYYTNNHYQSYYPIVLSPKR